MNKILLSLFIVSSLTVAEEVSVYGSDSAGQYGLNSSEKLLLKNQNNINNLNSKLSDINSLVNSINSRLEGLESTYEGDSKRLNSTVQKVNDLQQKVGSGSLDVASNSGNVSSANDPKMAEAVNGLKAAVAKLTTLVNKINSEYVSSTEMEKNMQQFITREEFEALKKSLGVKTAQVNPTKTTETKASSVSTADTQVVEPIKKNLTNEDKPKLFTEAKKDFDSKNYESASPKLEKLVEVNYKPAESNYYLAESWYMRKKYDVAISHFKKSAMLNDKAAYMPTLLLHSAISFENVKDKENAKNFYNTLIGLYPDSEESNLAKKNLAKIK